MSTELIDHVKVTFLAEENSHVLLQRKGNYSQLNNQLPAASDSAVGLFHDRLYFLQSIGFLLLEACACVALLLLIEGGGYLA